MSNIKGHIYGLIDEIKNAERITKAKLSVLSRDIMTYVLDSQDIESVNRLIGILTPMNKRTAILFFKHFLPWQTEQDTDGVFLRFGKKLQGEKQVNRKEKAIAEFLAVESNDIWTWSNENVDVEVKKKDFSGMIEKAVTQALNGDEKSDTPPLERSAILAAVFRAGVSLDDMLVAIGEEEKRLIAENEAAEAVMSAAEDGEFEPNH